MRFAPIALAAFALLCIGAAPHQDKTYSLHYKFEEGGGADYDVLIDVKAKDDEGEHTMHVEGAESLRCETAGSDSYRLKYVFEGKDFQGTGMFEDSKSDFMEDSEPTFGEIDSLGKLIDPDSEDDDTHLTPVLPQVPVKVGDTWEAGETQVYEGENEEPTILKITGKLVSSETVDGRDILTLEYENLDLLGFGPGAEPIRFRIDADTGRVLSMEGTAKESIAEDNYSSEVSFKETLQKPSAFRLASISPVSR